MAVDSREKICMKLYVWGRKEGKDRKKSFCLEENIEKLFSSVPLKKFKLFNDY